MAARQDDRVLGLPLQTLPNEVGSNENEDPENEDLRPKTHTKTKTRTKN